MKTINTTVLSVLHVKGKKSHPFTVNNEFYPNQEESVHQTFKFECGGRIFGIKNEVFCHLCNDCARGLGSSSGTVKEFSRHSMYVMISP